VGSSPAAAPNPPPTDIGLSSRSVAASQPAGTVVGALSTTDPDSRDPCRSAPVGAHPDNASFEIARNQFRTKASFAFEARAPCSVRARGADPERDRLRVTLAVADGTPIPSAAPAAPTREAAPEQLRCSPARPRIEPHGA
jgi:hypothetical protein